MSDETPGSLPDPQGENPERDREVAEGPGCRYRPGQIVVNAADVPLISQRLTRIGAVRDRRMDERLSRYLVRYRMPANREVVDWVEELRAPVDGRTPRVGPNHVFAGEPNYQGGPGGPPSPARGILEPATPKGAGDRIQVAVIDTGVAEDAQQRHPLLDGRYTAQAASVDPLDSVQPVGLDHQAGHGTFVSGIVALLAPYAGLVPVRVLSSDGFADELTIALGIMAAASDGATVLNLSLGGYTLGDQPPAAIEAVLDDLDPNIAVVAAAGNASSSRIFWPAAFKRVVAVAALDTTNGGSDLAKFSNYGWWVDACAPGVRILGCYVDGERVVDGETPTTFHGFACWDGTSFAAPQIAAAIAQRALDGGITPRAAAAELLADPKMERKPGCGVVVLPDVNLLGPC